MGISQYDPNKIVVDGQIMSQAATVNRESLSAPTTPGARGEPLDFTALDQLLNEDPKPQPHQQTELVADSEATP